MTNKEVLEKAITKAVEGGFNNGKSFTIKKLYEHGGEHLVAIVDTTGKVVPLHINGIIFNHDFAKALWGKSGTAKMHYIYPMNWGLFENDELHTTTALLSEWQYHLQQMVIAPDPIAYLAQNI